MEAAAFVQTVQNRQDVVISAPEEIAYHEKWIDKEKLLESANEYGKSPYGEHLRHVAVDKIIWKSIISSANDGASDLCITEDCYEG